MGRYLSLLIISLFILSACKGDDDTEKGIPPVFISSIPANGVQNVGIATEVTVTFDEVVTLKASHGITVNGTQVQAAAQFTKVVLEVSLTMGTQYTVRIPAGAVINTKKVPLQESIEFSFTTKPPVSDNIKQSLVLENPSPEAVKVYNFMRSNYGSKIISGAMANVSWNINEAIWVHSKTAKYPALNGFDLIHLYASAPGSWINYEDVSVIENWWNNNGLVTLMWHWNVPKNQSSTEYAFYTNETTFDISRAVQEGTWENGVIKADLAKAAITLKKLQEKNIPVLWRPLHEAAGTWFWWGAKGAEPCKALWRFMFNYFKDEGLNNLIWVWTVETNDDNWYPGNEYVDIIGRDIYHRNDVVWIATHYESIQNKYPDKIVALSECGDVSNIASQWNTGATWSFFMPWYDYGRTVNTSGAEFSKDDHTHANAAWWVTSFANPNVITRDQMPSLK